MSLNEVCVKGPLKRQMFAMNYSGQEALRAGHLTGNVLWKTQP